MPTVSQRAAPRSHFAPIATVAILFWLFSYALFTSRMQLRGDEAAAALFTLRRLLATAFGGLLYAAVLRFVIFPAGRKPAHPLFLVAAVIPAAAAMVAIRVLFDPLVSDDPLTLSEHLHWVLVWAGYFGLWLIGYAAWRMHGERAANAAAPAEPVPTTAPRTTAPRANARAIGQTARPGPSREALEDLIEAIAEEAARLPAAERRALVQRLGATYAEADDPFGTAKVKSAVVSRIAERISAR